MESPVRPELIAVCGMPAAGKTTLARALGRELHLPVVIRDDVKTGYARTWPDTDWPDPAVRARLGPQTFDAFHRIVDAHLDAGCAVVAEAAWHWGFARREMRPRFARSRATLICVELDPVVSAARYRTRFEAGERHPAHIDAMYAATMDATDYDWRVYIPPADLPVRIVTVDGGRPRDEVLATVLAALDPT